jgi:hypothetical protein
VKERPILFSAPMVRALLDGRKTQTRRMVKPQPLSQGYTPLISYNHGVAEISFGPHDEGPRGLRWWRSPYGQPGDALYVKETWQADVEDAPLKPSEIKPGRPIFYAAGGDKNRGALAVQSGGWRPSLFMPRWASRITLEITGVRVERLNDCSKTDAEAEGLVRLPATGRYAISKGDQYFGAAWFDPRAAYQALWEQINGPGSWEVNPWVWVVEFRRVETATAAAA